MIKILFVCHGNICRSAMAEYIMKNLLNERGIKSVDVISAGISDEENGSGIYPPARRTLEKHSIPYGYHRAHRVTDEEYFSSDYVYAMDSGNIGFLKRRFSDSKAEKLLPRDISDPWYTGDFEKSYNDILSGCLEILKSMEKQGIR